MEYELPSGDVCLVDSVDLPLMWSRKWHKTTIAGIEYVVANITVNGRRTTAYLHRLIMQPPTGAHVDHIDHNGLNNQRINLRMCSRFENMRNRRKRRATSSRFKGVSAVGSRWRAQLEIAGKHISLGLHATEELAAIAYNAGAVRHFGKFASPNIMTS